MNQSQLIRSAYLDTTKVIRGLDLIANPMNESTSKSSIEDVARLCYLLMTKDVIYCDGDVTNQNKSQIDTLFDTIETRYSEYVSTKLRKKILEKKFSPDEEILLSNQTIQETFAYYNKSASQAEHVVRKSSFDNGLSDPIKFLIDPISKGKVSQDYIENIRHSKSIVGRRFYSSILNNPMISERLLIFLRNERISTEDLPTMFSLFRGLLAAEKSNQLIAADDQLECIYQPDEIRASILKRFGRIHMELSDHVNFGLTNVWLKKVKDNNALLNLHHNQPLVLKESYDIPAILNLPLKANSKEDFLKQVLTFDKSEYYKHYNLAVDEIAKAKTTFEKSSALAEMEYYLTKKLSLDQQTGILKEADTTAFCSDIGKLIMRESTNNINIEDLTSPNMLIARKAVIPILRRVMKVDRGVRAGINIKRSFGSELIALTPGLRDKKLLDIFN